MNTFPTKGAISTWLVAVSVTLFFHTTALSQSNCPNSDFSMNNFTNWTGSTGTCCPINTPTPGIVAGRHTIMTGPGMDPQSCNQLPVVPPGFTYSARLGNSGTGAQGEALRYTLTVNQQNALFIYHYAVVLDDPNHSLAQQPRFELQVRDANNQVIPCTFYQVAAASNIPGFQNCGSWRWKPWTQVGVDLLPFLGQTVTIEARTGDCSLGGHAGYAYITAECRPMEIMVNYCIGDTIATLNAPDGFAAYQWSTGQTTQQISITNPAQIQVPISVTVTSVTGCQATLSVNLQPALVDANFSASNGCNGQVTFTDLTTVQPYGNAAQWQWSFGDGSTSNQQNPTHVYNAPGQYQVHLQTTSSTGCVDDTTITITVPPLIQAGFTFPNNGCGLAQVFQDQTQLIGGGSFQSWSWNFGDGNTSSQQHPSHTYANPGTYTVTLISTNNAGCSDTATQQLTLYSIPNAAFNAPQVCHGNPTAFFNQSTVQGGNITGWQWSFGDGNSSTQQNPQHSYANPGNYTVQLVVTGPGQCTDTISQNVFVPATPVANFTLPTACGLVDNFTDQSTINPGQIVQWNWNFGDNTTSNQQNPQHTYANPGTYNVTLTVTSLDGCSSSVTLQNPVYAIPVANFSAPQVCHPAPIVFTDQSTVQNSNINNWYWDFGDGLPPLNGPNPNPSHPYTTPGTYNVTLIVTGPGGCTDTTVIAVVNPPTPQANFVLPAQCDLTDYFADASTIFSGNITQWAWDFGDNNTSASTSPTHTYAQPGVYPVTLTVTSDMGCSHTVTQQNTVYDIPVASFTAPQTCHGLVTPFTDQSSVLGGGIQTWNWSFGDNNTSTTSNPNHQYGNPGTYNATLIVTGPGGCSDTVTNPVFIPPTPVADFQMPTDCGLVNTFTDQSAISSGNIVQWGWNFGDNGTSNVPSPTHTYNNQGTWPVTLIVVSDHGCSDTITQQFLNRTIPVANFTSSTVCFGSSTNLTDQSTVQSDQIVGWQWDMGTSNSNSQNPNYVFPGSGTVNVELVVTASNGCTDTVVLPVVIHPMPVPNFTSTSVCSGLVTSFTDQSIIAPGGSIVTYNWLLNPGTSNLQNPTTTYPSAGTHNVTLEVISDQGCQNSVVLPVTVHPRPQIHFDVSERAGCTPFTPFFTNQTTIVSGNVSSYVWNFGDGGTSTQVSPSYTYLVPGVYPVTLTATSNFGCDTTVTKNNYITVYPRPVADFIYTPNEPTMIEPTVQFLDKSYGAVVWDWNFGDGGVAAVQNPSHVYANDTGTYTVTLIIENEYGCLDTAYRLIHIDPDFTIFIPNTFTPNGDGKNEEFRIYGVNFFETELYIYDRWGEMVYFTRNNKVGWDGTHQGKIVKEDVYSYRAMVKDLFGKWHEFYGNVNVVR